MNEESKIAIVSHGAIVEFNPNSVEHRKILTDVTQGLMKNELELDRQSNLFIELVSNFSRAKISAQPFDTERHLTEFFKSTGVVVPQYLLLEAATIPPHDKVGDFYLVWRRGKFIKPGIPEFPSLDKLKVGDVIKSYDGKDVPIIGIHTSVPQSFIATHTHCGEGQRVTGPLAVSIRDKKETIFCSDLQLLVDSLEELSSKNVISGHGYADVKKELLRAFNNKNGTRIDITAFTKLIKKEVTPSELFVRIAEKKDVNSETYQLIKLHLKGMRYDHISVKPVTWEDIGGVIKTFKDMFFIEFSHKDLTRFFSGVITAEELLLLYVKLPEKKITTRAQYDQALNILIVLLDLFTPNAMTREDVERAKVLHIQFNIRFDIDMSEEDFLAIIYRHGTPRYFLKKHATTEATKGE